MGQVDDPAGGLAARSAVAAWAAGQVTVDAAAVTARNGASPRVSTVHERAMKALAIVHSSPTCPTSEQ